MCGIIARGLTLDGDLVANGLLYVTHKDLNMSAIYTCAFVIHLSFTQMLVLCDTVHLTVIHNHLSASHTTTCQRRYIHPQRLCPALPISPTLIF
jgi:hypothetical protein